MNKALSKHIMKRSNLRNKCLECRSEEDRQSYTKQRNLCVSLFRKTKRSYYLTFNKENVIDNQKLWKTVKQILLNKLVSRAKITLVENQKIITDDMRKAKVLNEFFSNISKTLNIPQTKEILLRRNNNNSKVYSIETGRIVIAHLLPWSDLEKYMYATLF